MGGIRTPDTTIFLYTDYPVTSTLVKYLWHTGQHAAGTAGQEAASNARAQ